MNTTFPQLEQIYPFINWQLLNLSSSVGQITIVGLSHHPYLISDIEQQTRLSFFQDDHQISCHLPSNLKIVSFQHGDFLYIFSFSGSPYKAVEVQNGRLLHQLK